MNWLLIFLPVGYLWLRLVDNLRMTWMTDPQYGYGLLVPFLCLGLALRRWNSFRSAEFDHSVTKTHAGILCFAGLAFLYLPIRLIEAAIPEWRIVEWALGLITVGLTLCAIRLSQGRGWLRQMLFPVCFFLVAIPWPTLIETPIIQTLTRLSASIVIELIGWQGVPAVAHGNIIQVSTGMVGIDEACSGIRSFQTSLMTCLFFGEFYRLRPSLRWLLIPIGFGLAVSFNICRMYLLTMVAAKQGVAAISRYHDPAGFTTAICCTLVLWGLAVLLSWKKSAPTSGTPAPARPPETPPELAQRKSLPTSLPISRLAIGLAVWLVMVEAGVQTWYHIRESRLNVGPAWTLNFPAQNPSLKTFPIDESTRNLLRYDDGKEAAWSDPDGSAWQAFYFDWRPGRVAGYLAKRHTPEICLSAIGLKLVDGPKLNVVNIHGVQLPIRSYVFANETGSYQVFHCRWEAGVGSDAYVQNDSARFNLIRAIWAGRGNRGQKVFEFVITGISDPQQAQQALTNQLNQLIVVQNHQ